MICEICGKEFIKNSNHQLCCSKECSKINHKINCKIYYINNIEEIHKYNNQYYNNNKEEELKRSNQYYQNHKEERSEQAKQYYNNNKEELLEQAKQWRQTSKGKECTKKYINRRQRNLGFNSLNKYFYDSEAHHIDEVNVIYIPKELHKTIYHNIFNNINMDKINTIAFFFLVMQNINEFRLF